MTTRAPDYCQSLGLEARQTVGERTRRVAPSTSCVCSWANLRKVRGGAQALAVGRGRAIEVDRVAPAFGDGCIEAAELFLDRSSVLGPHRLEKLLEQCSESSRDLHRRCTVLTDLGESERHEVLPAVSRHHDRGRRVGACRLRALLEVGPPDQAREPLQCGRGPGRRSWDRSPRVRALCLRCRPSSVSRTRGPGRSVRSSPSAIIPSSSSAARSPNSPP